MTTDAPPTNADAPPPKPAKGRIGCLGKSILAALLLVVAVAGAWLVWLAVATGQRDAALDRLRAAGVATSVEELAAQITPVADSANPAVDYAAAHALIDESAEAWAAWDEYRIPAEERTPEERIEFEALQRGVVASNGPALTAVAAADGKIRPAVEITAGDFGVWSQKNGPLPANLIEVDLPHLNRLRSLADLLHADALVAAENGDAPCVLRNVVRLIGLADAIDADAHVLVEHLVAGSIRGLAAKAVLAIVPVAADAPAELADVITALLLDDAPTAAGFRASMEGEAAFQQSTLALVETGELTVGLEDARGSVGARLINTLLRPAVRLNQRRAADYLCGFLPLGDLARVPAAEAAMPDGAWLHDVSYFDALAFVLTASFDRAVSREFRLRSDCRLAAAALAIRRYERDHGGDLPPELSALVPAYLPRVPVDPMAADGELRYDAGRGLLWSVGEDAADDGGDATPLRGSRRGGRWDARDAVVVLRPGG